MNKASSKKKEKQKEKDLQARIQNRIGVVIKDFIGANPKLIGIVALVIVVIVALGVGWSMYKKSLNEKALVLENEAMELYNTISSKAKPDKPDTPTKSYQDVLNIYQQIIEKYAGTESAERALYLSGSLEYNLEHYEQAQKYFTLYVEKYPKGKLRFQAEEGIGYIFEQLKEYQKAIEQFKSTEAKAPSSDKSQILLAIGRNYESLGQFDKAIETYQQVVDSNTSVSWKDKARERLEILQTSHL
jgi:tetratricopeptide (TPR) repeat protein